MRIRPVNNVQQNFSGSNSFGTMKICSRQGKFELMSVNHSARSEGIIGISFPFSHQGIQCVFSFESHRRGDSIEYTQYTTFNNKKITLNYPKSAAMEFFIGTQEGVRDSGGKRLLLLCCCFTSTVNI